MGDFHDYKDRVKRYFVFSKQELTTLAITILVIAFIITFKDWVLTESGMLDISNTLFNIFNGMIVAALIVLIHESAHRLIAIKAGFTPEIRLWWMGVLVALIMVFVSRGSIWLLFAPGVFIHHQEIHRLGAFRYGLNMMANKWICLSGIFAVLMLSILVKVLLVFFPGNVLLQKALLVAIWYAVVNMLPIPPLDGSRIFYIPTGYLRYTFFFSLTVGIALFMLVPITGLWMIWLLLLGGLFVGIGGWYYVLQQHL